MTVRRTSCTIPGCAERDVQGGTDSGTLGSSRSLHLDRCGGPWHHAERAGAWGQGTRHLWQTTRPAVTHTTSSLLQQPTQRVLLGHHSHPPSAPLVSPSAPGALVVKWGWVGGWRGRGCGCGCRCDQGLECSALPVRVCCGRLAYRWPVRSPDNSLAPATVCPTATARGFPRDMRKGWCHLTYNISLDKYLSMV